MPNRQRLEIKQSQSLVMTPQLQQSIKLLQLSTIELTAYITQELERNPLLTREDAEEESQTLANDDEAKPETSQEDAVDAALSGQVKDDSFEENYKEAWDASGPSSDPSYPTYNHITNDNHSAGYAFEETQASPQSLKEHITDQINIAVADHSDRIIALHLTDMLDDNGYIVSDFSSIAKVLECSQEQIEQVLFRLQMLDPPGVFARSVAECLTLQLKDLNQLTPPMERLLEHLDLLATGELKQLQKICRVDEERLKELIREIRALNPKPGTIFSAEVVQVVQPDVYLKKDGKGSWVVALNNNALPKILVNKRYIEEIGQKTHKEEDKKYIAEQASAANWLVKVLDQRAQTILKVAKEIVVQQQEFFERGIRYLKPLTLTDVAKAIDMHESTVSRVTTHKYMATPLGLYELKYFFSSSIARAEGGEGYSSRSIKFLIQELIANETPDQVLSDEHITVLLKERGIEIARRTVAKYREDSGIATSSKRKREKRLG